MSERNREVNQQTKLMKLNRLESVIVRAIALFLLATSVTALRVQGALATGVTITFGTETAVVRWQGTSGVKYRVERSLDGGVTWQGIDAPTTASVETNILIAPPANTDFRVVSWVNAYPNDTRSPSTPSGVNGQAPACDRVALTWNASSDSGKGATGPGEYLIYRNGAFLKSVPAVIGAGSISTADTTVVGQRTYKYQVAALDRAGNASSRSGALNVTTPTCTCFHMISATGSPGVGGSVTGGGTVTCDSIVALTATPAACYTFANWTENGTVVSTSPSYSFIAATDRGLVANFTLKTFTVAASVSASGGGSVGGGGTAGCGSSVTLTATPDECSTFANWTDNGVAVSSSPSYTFTAFANRTLVANFTPKTSLITASASPTVGGTASGSGSVNCGATVTVTASPASGYTFANWTEGGTVVSGSASFSFTAGVNRTLTANFTQVVPPSTPVGYWTFDTATVSGTTASDSSGHGNNGTLAGTVLPTLVPGRKLDAIDLDGVSERVTVADSTDLNLTGPFAISAWVNFSTLPALSKYPSVVAKLTNSK